MEGLDMDEKELSEVTRKTAEKLFGPPKKGEGAYALWRQFNPELAKQFSLFFTGRLYAREVLSQKQRELCAVAPTLSAAWQCIRSSSWKLRTVNAATAHSSRTSCGCTARPHST